MADQTGGLLATIDWAVEPKSIVDVFEHASRRIETPCGNGTMVWRGWGRGQTGRLPVVLLHGGSGSWTHWIKIIPALAAAGEVWAADLPGLGDSAMPHAPHVPATCGQVVADGLRAVFADGIGVHLVGFSFGAHVGTFAAALLGDQLASFTICGSAALGLKHNRLNMARERSTMTTEQRNVVHRINLEKLMFAEPGRIDALAIHLQAGNVRRARFKSREFAGTAEIPETLPRVMAPLRAIWGARDVLATPSVEARYAILRAHHPELRTWTIADAGHWVQYEQPAAFLQAIGEMADTVLTR